MAGTNLIERLRDPLALSPLQSQQLMKAAADELEKLQAIAEAAEEYIKVKSNPRTNVTLNLIGPMRNLKQALAAWRDDD